VYSTCIFCHTGLGSNESIEHFPVGRRLAFDAAKGRLWAVCKSCERWNLSPIDERWEAIEECEKLFRGTKLRVSTDNIGLARLKDGTTLVRVGDPQRPEMAAWRYGDQFGRRRRKSIATASAGFVIAGGAVVAIYASKVLGASVSLGSSLINLANSMYVQRRRRRVLVKLPVNGTFVQLAQSNVDEVRLHSNEAQGFALELTHWPTKEQLRNERFVSRALPRMYAVHTMPTAIVSGDQAIHAARLILPWVNHAGAKRDEVAKAVEVLEQSRGPEQLFGHTAFVQRSIAISALPTPVRLALEMSLHEEDERRALEGELAELESRWREAEEVAAISDDMFVPSGVSALLGKLKRGG
jgi:hypothetical protein